MNIERITQLIESYGASPERWPHEERADAEALLRRSAEARAALEEGRRLDSLLDAYRVEQPSERLIAAILATAPRASLGTRAMAWISGVRERFGAWWGGPAWQPVAALGSAALLGVWISVQTSVMFAGAFTDVADLSTEAMASSWTDEFDLDVDEGAEI